MTLFDAANRPIPEDSEHRRVVMALRHWLSCRSVNKRIRELGTYPNQQHINQIADGSITLEAAAHYFVRNIRTRKVRRDIAQLISANSPTQKNRFEVERGLMAWADLLAIPAAHARPRAEHDKLVERAEKSGLVLPSTAR